MTAVLDEAARTSAAPDRAPRPGRRAWWPWALLAPALLVMAGLLLWPMVRVVVLSLQDFGLRELVTGRVRWNAPGNYVSVLGDSALWSVALPNTVGFAVVTVVLTVVVGTLVALLLARLAPLTRGLLTTAILAAWAVPAVTGTYVWVFLFSPGDGPGSGALIQALGALGLLDPATANPFTDRLGFYAVAALNVVHHGFPFVALTVLAGLLTVPKELHEAATVDGASAWRRFWSVTFPVLRPVFAVVTVLSTIWDFKVFTQVYLMPGGDGINRGVLNLGTWSYTQSFAQNEFGLGAAIAVLLTVLLLLITLGYLRILFREDEL